MDTELKEVKKLTLFFPIELYEAMRKYKFDHRMNYSDIIRIAVREYLDKEKK